MGGGWGGGGLEGGGEGWGVGGGGWGWGGGGGGGGDEPCIQLVRQPTIKAKNHGTVGFQGLATWAGESKLADCTCH